ncbi:MAG: AAA family ATPase [Anaerolineae bacterium]
MTILFADLTGSTAAGEAADPEELAAVINGAFEIMTRAVADAGGHIARLMGDGMLAFFGAPVSHEDDPLRAVRAALAIRDGVQAFARGLDPQTWPGELHVRLGLDSGMVLVGRVGSDLFSEYTTVGDPANTAARLQSAAPPDEILVSEATARLVHGTLGLEPVAPLQLKGKARPVAALRVTGAPPEAGTVVRGLPGVTSPVVDRDAERGRLRRLFDDAVESRHGSWVTIVGPAGVGKSRLVDAFLGDLATGDQEATMLRSRALDQESGTAFALVRDLVARRYGAQRGEAAEDRRRLVEAGVTRDLAGHPPVHASRAAADLSRLVAPAAKAGAEAEADAEAEAQEIAERALGALVQVLGTLAAREPVVMVMEDLHWADDASLDAVGRLADALAQQPVLLVGNARPDLFERRPLWGEGEMSHLRVDLAPLTVRGSRRLVRALVDPDGDLPPAAMDFVVERSEGNPYFIEELVRMLLHRGALDHRGEAWHFDGDRLAASPVPATLQGILQAHLDSLEPVEKRSLQRASVVGRVFWAGAVEALGVTTPGILDRLRGRGFVYARERSTFPGDREFLFRHALLCDAAYATVLKAERPDLHGRAADWMLAHAGDRYSDLAAQIAGHCAAAGRKAAAAAHYVAAAEASRGAYANAGAVQLYGRGLALAGDDEALRFDALKGREIALDALGDRDAQAADLAAMGELAAHRGPLAASYVRFRRSWLAHRLGDNPAAAREAEAALALAGDDERARGDALVNLGNATLRLGKPEEARGHYAAARGAFEKVGNERRGAIAAMLLASADHEAGNVASARAGLEEALARFQALDDLRRQAVTHTNLAVLLATSGAFDEACPHFEAALALYRAAGDRGGEAKALANLGLAAREEGNLDLAAERLRSALRLRRQVQDRRGELGDLGDLAGVLEAAGDAAGAAEVAAAAEALAAELPA